MTPKPNVISIVVASDNYYAVLIAVLLKSIEVNHKSGELIDFYIIDDHISGSAKRKIERLASPDLIRVRWIDSRNLVPAGISIPIDSSSFPLTAYYRIFAPYAIDQDVEKLIYLDVDTIVRTDISELWNIPLGAFSVGAVQDLGKTVSCKWGGIPNYQQLGLAEDTKYFNSGVLLMNPRKWREERITEKVIQALIDNRKHVRFADQYGLNVALANNWLELDPRWNWFAVHAHEDPFIVHFLAIKPIFKSYNSEVVWQDEFFSYLRLSPWKGYRLRSGNTRVFRKAYVKIKKMVLRSVSRVSSLPQR